MSLALQWNCLVEISQRHTGCVYIALRGIMTVHIGILVLTNSDNYRSEDAVA